MNNEPNRSFLFFSEKLAYDKYLTLIENNIEEIEGINDLSDIEGYTDNYQESENFIDFVTRNINSTYLSFWIYNVKVK